MGKLTRDHLGDSLGIWQGGFFSYSENQLEAIKEALVKFQQIDDTRANVGVSLSFSSGQVSSILATSLGNC